MSGEEDQSSSYFVPPEPDMHAALLAMARLAARLLDENWRDIPKYKEKAE